MTASVEEVGDHHPALIPIKELGRDQASKDPARRDAGAGSP